MKKSNCCYRLLPITLSLLMIASACAKGSITSQEKREVEHFKKAHRLWLEGSRYLNKITSGDFVVGSMSETERNTYIKMLVDTLTEANLVSDITLSKIHPLLPSAYLSIFIPCLENKLRGFRDFDPAASVKGTILHNEWIDWWNAHYLEFANIVGIRKGRSNR